MKTSCLILFLLITPSLLVAQGSCTDPAGCSAASFVTYKDTIGIVQFGNSTGKVISKQKTNLCPESDCASFFNMTTAITGPRSTAPATNPIALEDLRILAVRRALTTVTTGVYSNSLNLAGSAFQPVLTPTKFSSFPYSKGFGNQAVGFLAAAGTKLKIASNLLDPVTNDLKSPSNLTPLFLNYRAAAVNREGSLEAFAQRKDAQIINLNFRELNPLTRKPIGPTEVIPQNYPLTATDVDTITSLALSDDLEPSTSANFPGGRKQKWIACYEEERKRGLTHQAAVKIAIRKYGEDPNGPISLAPSVLEPPIVISNFAPTLQFGTLVYQVVAIDPKGRFVLYAKFNPGCKKNQLNFQRINPLTGAKIGGPKVLVNCVDVSASTTGVYGLDVINLD